MIDSCGGDSSLYSFSVGFLGAGRGNGLREGSPLGGNSPLSLLT